MRDDKVKLRYDPDRLKVWLRERLCERRSEREHLQQVLREFTEHNRKVAAKRLAELQATQDFNLLKLPAQTLEQTLKLQELLASDVGRALYERAGRQAMWPLPYKLDPTFEDILDDVKFIRRECRRQLGFPCARDFALEIVAVAAGVRVDEVLNYSKNRSKRRK